MERFSERTHSELQMELEKENQGIEKEERVNAARWPQLSDKSLWQEAREDRANAIDETRRGIRR